MTKKSKVITDTDRINWLEEIVNNGACPALINDDNGHWAEETTY